MYYIPPFTLLYGRFIDIKHVNIVCFETKLACSEYENLKFVIYFFNKDISLNISLICLKFSIQGVKGQMEGSVSQNFYLGPTFYFIQSRKLIFKK